MTSTCHPTPPTLSAFLVVARQGAALQLRSHAGALCVVDAALPMQPGDAVLPVLAAFEAALADHFGGDVAGQALAETRPCLDKAGALPADQVLNAWGAAESQCTMNDARSFMQQMALSARLLGKRFCALCDELGIDAGSLPAERREALDQAVGWRPGLRVAEAEVRLRQLLAGAQLH